jgi:serine/threonine protein phosphatase PrpC
MFRRHRLKPGGDGLAPLGASGGRIIFQPNLEIVDPTGPQVAVASDQGCVREQNEDYIGVFAPPQGASEQAGLLAVLADGMGGHAAGEVASELAVSTIAMNFYQPDLPDEEEALKEGPASVAHRLTQAFLAANRAIRQASTASRDQVGMGCTCIAVAVAGREVTLAHVGDTRAYLIHPPISPEASSQHAADIICQLTSDHSLAAEFVRAGVLSEAEARYSSHRHVVTRALGGRDEDGPTEPDLQTWLVQGGETLLLCCDGLWGLVSDQQIAAVVQGAPLAQAASSLIELAKKAGGEDNISVVLLRFP